MYRPRRHCVKRSLNPMRPSDSSTPKVFQKDVVIEDIVVSEAVRVQEEKTHITRWGRRPGGRVGHIKNGRVGHIKSRSRPTYVPCAHGSIVRFDSTILLFIACSSSCRLGEGREYQCVESGFEEHRFLTLLLYPVVLRSCLRWMGPNTCSLRQPGCTMLSFMLHCVDCARNPALHPLFVFFSSSSTRRRRPTLISESLLTWYVAQACLLLNCF